jgi:WD40-like Beta Propeller Repeat
MAVGRGIALASVLLASCGTVQELLGLVVTDSGGTEGTGAGPDGDAQAGADTGDAAGPCDLTKPFGAPVAITELESAGAEGGLRLFPDELTGFFWSTRAGGPGTANIYATTRPDRASPFGAITLLDNVNSTGTFQLDPTSLPSGLTLIFRSIRAEAGAGGDDLFSAARADTDADFSQAAPITSLNSASNDVQPFVTSDGAEVYYASDRTGNYEIYRATVQGGVYGAPTPVAELNQAGVDDADPVLSADRLTIFFASTRPGGQGGSDIWTATRTSTTSAFGASTNVAELNSTAQDDPTWLSVDRCRLYMSVGSMPSTHEYVATRPR